MRRHERGDVSIPTAKQHCRTSIIRLGQSEAAVFLRHLDPKRADLRESFEILRRNFTGAIDLIGIDMFAQIGFNLAQKLLTSGPILGALGGVRMDSIEIGKARGPVRGGRRRRCGAARACPSAPDWRSSFPHAKKPARMLGRQSGKMPELLIKFRSVSRMLF